VLKCASWKLKFSLAQKLSILLIVLEIITGPALSIELIAEIAVCVELPNRSVDCTK
jgi:hypothetical protein